MVFSSIVFLYYFLPVMVGVYFVCPARLQNAALLAGSLFFYAWGEPRYIVVMGCSVLSGYAGGLLAEKYRGKRAGLAACIVSAGVSLAFLLYFKYAGFLLANLRAVTGWDVWLPAVALPVGISFYTFQLVSYVVDVYYGEAAQKNILRLAVYITMFPQLIAGPIVRYASIADQLGERKHSFAAAAWGIRRFVYGLAKKILLADQLGEMCAVFRASEEKSVLFYWLYAVGCTLYIYFDFSGYSDMAVGLGRVFGFYFPENFCAPFLSTSMTEFWRRWHRSLGTWFRDYVYIPLGGNRCGRGRQIVHISFVWMLTGLWHGAEWNFVWWGLYFAVLLIFEKNCIRVFSAGVRRVVMRIYFLFFIVISFVLFHASEMEQAVSDIGGLFGAGGIPLVSQEALYCLRSYGVVMLAAAAGAGPIAAAAEKYRSVRTMDAGGRIWSAAEPVLILALFVVMTAYLADGSFQPFLYFRF